MNEVTRPAPTGVANAALINSLRAGIQQSKQQTIVQGGKPLLRLSRQFEWIFGQTNEKVEDGSIWVVNPLTLAHGWVCWSNNASDDVNSLLGEKMAPVSEPLPPMPAAINGYEFKPQRGMELKCLNGRHEDIQVLYKGSSGGGVKGFVALIDKIYAQLAERPDFPCPVVELEYETYDHKKWGTIANPIFNVVDWASLDEAILMSENDELNLIDAGEEAGPPPAKTRAAPPPKAPPPPKPAPQHEPEVASKRPLRRQAQEEAVEEPAPTARRRPLRRA